MNGITERFRNLPTVDRGNQLTPHLTPYLLCLLICPALFCGCTAVPRPTPASILLKDSKSRPIPTLDVQGHLLKVPENQVAGLIDQYLDVVETNHGYARLVALRGLLNFTDGGRSGFFDMSHTNRQYITQRLVDDVARYAVRVTKDDTLIGAPLEDILSDQPRSFTYKTPSGIEMTCPMDEPDYWFNKPVDAEFEMQVDGLQIPLASVGFRAWRFGAAKVWLDGKLILDKPDVGLTGVVTLRLKDFLNKDRTKVLGNHVIRTELQVVSPNKLVSTATSEHEFTIYQAPATRAVE